MTPCEKLGYKVGDKFRYTGEDHYIAYTLKLVEDDGTCIPCFERLDWMTSRFIHVDNVTPLKPIDDITPLKPKPEDEITITTTYGALAEVYAVMGKSNGDPGEGDLWSIAEKILDPNRRVYNELSPELTGSIDYESIQEEWLEALFPTEVGCPKQKQLQEVISNLEEQLREAKNTLKSIKGE